MTLEQLYRELQLEIAPEILAPYWAEDMATLPEMPELLRPEIFLPLREFVGIEANVDALLTETAAEIRTHSALRALFWHCYQLLFFHLDYPADKIRQWPSLAHILGERHGIFYLLVALGAVPLAREKHQARGIPEEITRGIAGNFRELLWNFAELNNGLVGADVRVLFWLRNGAGGHLYRLGRMEYMCRPFHGPIRAFRHRQTGEIVALAEDGVRYTAEGYIGGPEGPEAPGAWLSSLIVEADRVRGHLIHPCGYALRDEILELPLGEWECVLQRGVPILECHIPGGGNFLPELVRESMRRAAEFFPRYFPEQFFVGFACHSWILNPEWHLIYKPENNITKWQQELYLYPIPSSGRDGLHFLFAREDIDLKTAPRDTSMRRAVLDWLEQGRWLRGGGGFMLTEHLPYYGQQFYRRQPRFAAR